MASIVLSSVGRAVGAASGVPFGAQLGSMLGGVVANRLGGTSKHTYDGARLESLAVQTSTYGRMIPIVFGTVRIAGNVLWSRPMREVATTTTTRTGGKGGAGGRRTSSSSTTYSYYVTLAIGICEGELARVSRVWADSKLLDLSQGTYRIYKGTTAQLPDPLIESYEGVGRTPAYRGMAYVVIEDFPLADFGNRIPNFSFEVTRRTPQQDVGPTHVETMVKSLMLIPGSGEFVYDTQRQYKLSGASTGSGVAQSGYQFPLNAHTPEGKANLLVALDQMQETFPNLEWVGVVVNWFGTSMDIATCDVWPCVEYQTTSITTPDDWSVAGFTRTSGRLIGQDAGRPRYGGTPDDDSILRLLTELRARGLKIFLYPMLLMDVAGKPWRGYLTGAAAAVTNFFTKTRGYNAFVTHYANLAVGKIDAFAIGTELKDLTKITSAAGVYPAVSELMTLASTVKTTLGAGVKVTYAADWSEYHHTDGGWYHLDPLWASASIDMVGIDAYFPLSDAVQNGYDIDALKQGWVSGEGYDWYYSDPARTIQAPLSAPYAWKNIAWWWNNTHFNPGGGVTPWVPASKPIWFTEYGFPSVDGCANQPNVFVDASSSGSAFPRFSRGRVDFMAQRAAIAATESQWAGSGMITQKFLWTWDARPYPFWPDLREVWSDGASWVTGHWVQGKLGASHVAGAVEQIAMRAGLTASQIDTSALQLVLDGYVLNDRITARGALEQLMQAYFFSLKEGASALTPIVRDSSVDATVNAAECIEQKAGEQTVPYILTREEDMALPAGVEVHALNRLQRYETHIQRAIRHVSDANDTRSMRFSLVLSGQHAELIAKTALADAWSERSRVKLQLPLRFAALEPGDTLQLVDGAITYRLKIQKVQIGKPGVVRVHAVVDASHTWDGYVPPTIGGDGGSVTPNPVTALAVLDIPALPTDAQDALTLRFAVCGLAEGWKGATLVRDMASGDDEILLTIDKPATMGSAVTVLPTGPSHRFDEAATVEVALLGGGTLANATERAVLDGANVAVLGNEVIQFKTATSIAAGVYRLSGLLRGRLGTEHAIASHVTNDRFVLLDDAVQALTLPLGQWQQHWQVRAVTFGDSLNTGTVQALSVQANSLKPLSPVHASAQRTPATNDVTVRWARRARIDGSLRDFIDIPLMEQRELYDARVFSGTTLLRSWRVSTPEILYTAAEQTADFGSFPSTLTLDIRQISALVGPGFAWAGTVTVS
jgi:hypothetical protein